MTGCSHAEKRVEEKIATQSPVKNSAELSHEAHFLIETNPIFTHEQKLKLYDLQKQTQLKLNILREESMKIRMLLIEEITGEVNHSKELEVIKSKLKNNEEQRVETYFAAIRNANEILGRKSEQKKRAEFMKDFVGFRDHLD